MHHPAGWCGWGAVPTCRNRSSWEGCRSRAAPRSGDPGRAIPGSAARWVAVRRQPPHPPLKRFWREDQPCRPPQLLPRLSRLRRASGDRGRNGLLRRAGAATGPGGEGRRAGRAHPQAGALGSLYERPPRWIGLALLLRLTGEVRLARSEGHVVRSQTDGVVGLRSERPFPTHRACAGPGREVRLAPPSGARGPNWGGKWFGDRRGNRPGSPACLQVSYLPSPAQRREGAGGGLSNGNQLPSIAAGSSQ